MISEGGLITGLRWRWRFSGPIGRLILLLYYGGRAFVFGYLAMAIYYIILCSNEILR